MKPESPRLQRKMCVSWADPHKYDGLAREVRLNGEVRDERNSLCGVQHARLGVERD